MLNAIGNPSWARGNQGKSWKIKKTHWKVEEDLHGQIREKNQAEFGVQWQPTGFNVHSKSDHQVYKFKSSLPQSWLLCSFILVDFLNSFNHFVNSLFMCQTSCNIQCCLYAKSSALAFQETLTCSSEPFKSKMPTSLNWTYIIQLKHKGEPAMVFVI